MTKAESNKKKPLFFIILLVVSPILLILAAEIMIRIYMNLRFRIPGKSYGIYMADKELGAIHKPNSFNSKAVINNFGLANREDTPLQKPAGSTRIYCSGGSTTFCYNLAIDDTWPSLLQEKLRKLPGHQKDAVLNAGEICFSVSHEFILAKRLIPVLKPDIVILYGAGINEGQIDSALRTKKDKRILDQLLAQKKWGVSPVKLDQARFLKRNSMLIKLIEYYINPWLQNMAQQASRNKLKTESLGNKTTIHPWVIENFKITLREYIRFLKANGCQVILVNNSDNGSTQNWFINTYARPLRQYALEIAKEEGVRICDLGPLVENNAHRKELYTITGLHATKEGTELVSDALLATLKESWENK